MTNKKLNIVLAGVLCSVGVMAHESTPVIDQKKDVVELGRKVSYDETEMTGAVSTVRSEALSHKNSIKPSNPLYGMTPVFMVLPNG